MMRNKMFKLICCFVLIIFLISCSARISKANFDHIQPGMSFQEVISILGQPTSSSTISLGAVVGTSANWENRNGAISIQFFNGKVKIKQFIEGVTTPREL